MSRTAKNPTRQNVSPGLANPLISSAQQLMTLQEISHTCMGHLESVIPSDLIAVEHDLINMTFIQRNVKVAVWELGQF